MGEDLFLKVKEKKEKYHEKINERLRDKVRREAKDTLSFVDRMRARGKTDREIMRDLDKSRYKNKGQ
jgi:hypothetical protein